MFRDKSSEYLESPTSTNCRFVYSMLHLTFRVSSAFTSIISNHNVAFLSCYRLSFVISAHIFCYLLYENKFTLLFFNFLLPNDGRPPSWYLDTPKVSHECCFGGLSSSCSLTLQRSSYSNNLKPLPGLFVVSNQFSLLIFLGYHIHDPHKFRRLGICFFF